ncbi:MAG TPA: pyruvate, phosphate dikinase, partial [Armatimonadota bacterium]|nr:pyruvate, phosphate dikinase [Armatimonadota bacterium]
MSQKEKQVWLFAEGNASMRDLLGGKGANLAEMTNIGLPVPPGFVITTAVCNEYTRLGRLPDGLMEDVKTALKDVEAKMGKGFGDAKNPLLVSVRSGARFSMPGMMDTILNLGLNESTIEGLIKLTNDGRFVYDAYRRFVMMFGDVVLGVPKEKCEHLFSEMKEKLGAKQDTDVDADHLKELTQQFKSLIQSQIGRSFPNDPMEQLQLAIEAVFRSWNNPRAIVYRRREKISDDLGTAVNVQSMVFGNMGNDCGTGVAFTRNASNGDAHVFGEYLMNAQGEDVVAGVRTPMPIADLERENPKIYRQFDDICKKLEDHYHDMMDIEFTIETGRLYILQCRVGKRTGPAAVKIAVDMVREGRISKDEALLRVNPDMLDQCLHPVITPGSKYHVIARGLPAGPGAATGIAVFDAGRAAELGKGGKGQHVILVRADTSPDDLKGMLASEGVLTERGGMTSHAALVARGFGIPTVAGCTAIRVNDEARQFTADGAVIKEGDAISLNGTLGEVIEGAVEVQDPELTDEFGTLLQWANEKKRLGVRTNADTPADAELAIRFGAEGIGLCRTEHMFFAPERRPIVQAMILAETTEERKAQLDLLLPFQRSDFEGIFKAMAGRPVTVRLIDPPLHEFLPHLDELRVSVLELQLTDRSSPKLKEQEKLLHKVESMHEVNPMLGLRGVRLSILFPEIVEMQVTAIMEAAAALTKQGVEVHPEIMIPLVGTVNELSLIQSQLDAVVKKVLAKADVPVDYKFGT